MSVFYNNLVRLCLEKGVSPSKAANDVGISSASVVGWRRDAIPRETTIKKLADYFGCSIEELTEEQSEKKAEKKPVTVSDGYDVNMLVNNREELKKLVDRLTPEEVAFYLADFRKTILGE